MNKKAAPSLRFNIIDALFLIVILAATGVLVYILFFHSAETADTKTIPTSSIKSSFAWYARSSKAKLTSATR